MWVGAAVLAGGALIAVVLPFSSRADAAAQTTHAEVDKGPNAAEPVRLAA
jgi:hypothetical protein